MTQEVLDTTRSLSSYLVVQQLLELGRLLAPYRANRAVADFLARLDGELHGRLWFSWWLAGDGREHPAEPGEGA